MGGPVEAPLLPFEDAMPMDQLCVTAQQLLNLAGTARAAGAMALADQGRACARFPDLLPYTTALTRTLAYFRDRLSGLLQQALGDNGPALLRQVSDVLAPQIESAPLPQPGLAVLT